MAYFEKYLIIYSIPPKVILWFNGIKEYTISQRHFTIFDNRK